MYDYYEEPYYEPTAGDMIFEEAKQKLEECLKESIKYDIKRTKEENERLKKENSKLRSQVNDIVRRERELEESKKNVSYDKLTTLMKDRAMIMYKADYKYKYLPKCDKCDDNRRIKFLSPSNKEYNEACDCGKSITIYLPSEQVCYEMRKDSSSSRMLMWFRRYSDDRDDGYSSGEVCKEPWNGEDYDGLNKYSTFFKSKEECQAYCDWLNRDIELDGLVDFKTKSNQKKRS